jgi:hypothetical protein
VQVARYDAPPGLGPSLEYTETSTHETGFDPIVHLAMAPTSFGAWLVWQANGASAEVVPPIVAVRLDAAGKPLPGKQDIVVMGGGYIPPATAVAALGDNLVFAWVDALDPGPPVIGIQIVRADGSLGPSTAIPTNDAWLVGGVRLLASPAQDSVLVAWGAFVNDHRVGLARVDCASGL